MDEAEELGTTMLGAGAFLGDGHFYGGEPEPVVTPLFDGAAAEQDAPVG